MNQADAKENPPFLLNAMQWLTAILPGRQPSGLHFQVEPTSPPAGRQGEDITMDRRADARWNGDLKGGNGSVKLGSGAFEGQYSFSSRFESGTGTNPEELLGAAHAACFSMALAAGLGKAGHSPKSVETTATVHLTKGDAGFSISSIDLVTRGDVPGLSAGEFTKFAEDTKVGCIVSRALASVPMTVQATLTNG